MKEIKEKGKQEGNKKETLSHPSTWSISLKVL